MDTAASHQIYIERINLPRVVIIGGGFAGIELVKALNSDLYQIIMLDRHNYHTFQPLLYQVATAGLEPDSIAQPLRKIFEGKKNFHFRVATVEHVDTTKKYLQTDIGDLNYDILVVAVGTKTNYFGNENMRLATFPMKQVPHALDLRSHMLQAFEAALMEQDPLQRQALLNFVIIGGGPTGVELAGALSELRSHVLPNDYPELDLAQMKIYLIEGSGQVLNAMSDKSSSLALKYMHQFGVEVRLNTIVDQVEGNQVSFKDGTSISSNNVIWAAGVTGNLFDGFTKETIMKGNRLMTDRYNHVAGLQDIYAIGDIAAVQGDEPYPAGHPQLAPVAIQQGQLLAKNLNRHAKGQALKQFDYFNKGIMATVGRNKAVVDLPNGWTFGGFIGWLAWNFVHLLYLVGFRNKIIVMINWIISYFTYDRGTRLIIRPFIKNRQTTQPPPNSTIIVEAPRAEAVA